MIDQLRIKQLVLFGLLAVVSYSIYERYFNPSNEDVYQPFTKGYALTGVLLRSTNDLGQVITTVESPAITHYADTEVTVVEEPSITLHDASGDWVFRSPKGEINADQTTIYFPGDVTVDLVGEAADPVSISTSELLVDVTSKQGNTQAELMLNQLGSMLKGVGAVIKFNQQEIEILSELYAEFEN